MSDEDPDAPRRLREALSRHVGTIEAIAIVERALRQATLEAVPRDRGRLASFVEGYVAPLVVARLAPSARAEARESLRRVALGARSSMRPPPEPEPYRDGAATLEVAIRRFEDILVVSADAALDTALRPFGELGANLLRVQAGAEDAIARARGSLLVVIDGRQASSIDGALARLAARREKTTVIVIGAPAIADRARRTFGLGPVVLLPADVGIEQLRSVVRLGPS